MGIHASVSLVLAHLIPSVVMVTLKPGKNETMLTLTMVMAETRSAMLKMDIHDLVSLVIALLTQHEVTV